MKRLLPLVALVSLVFVGADSRTKAPSVDWPAWRGPERTGISKETGLLPSWPEGGPKLLWKVAGIGEGYSTPSIAGKHLFLMSNDGDSEWVIALDRMAKGKRAWAVPVGPRTEVSVPGPRSTPTVDGNRIYTLALSGNLVCLDRTKGKEVWKRNLISEFGGSQGGWGYCESVLVDGPLVLSTPGGNQATLLALDKKNGEVVWEAKIGDQAGYSSIIKIEVDGVKQYVQFTANGVVGVDAKSGELLWRYNAPANGTANAATPLFADESVFASSNYGTGGGLVRLTRHGNGFNADEVYFTRKMKNHHGGMILVDGYLYGSDDAILTCLEFATGKVMWQDRSCGKSSLVYADGMLYVRNESGLVSLVRATPDGFELKGRFEQPDRSGANSWSHPVVADGRLYLRDQDKLLCYDIRADGKP